MIGNQFSYPQLQFTVLTQAQIIVMFLSYGKKCPAVFISLAEISNMIRNINFFVHGHRPDNTQRNF